MNSRALVTNIPDRISLAPWMIICSERELVESLYKLKDVVLEPECVPFHKTYGVSFYKYAAKDPRLSSLFDETMVFKVYTGFEEVKEFMDVGGGNGTSLGKIVSTILHNWDDDRCIMLLKNCWKALPDDDNGKVIVVEFAIPQLLQNDAEAINTIVSTSI
ncbi:(S)-scoulerine 9-O-methyltransferase-like [Cornus florida]|uniref:(S)-scoulerine 9-O-methyltransferase-like n=1 Tax=Cornus florida TaxID=4283 RepID=UPI00289C9180|nr:(S)-scoulerine 9-O-methyltransferase-like [Cornus florida]